MEIEATLEEKLQNFARRLDCFECKLDLNTAATKQIQTDTSTLVEFAKAFAGFATMLRWIGRVVRPIGAFLGAALTIYFAWKANKS